ncbi:MAG: hypothetical protein GY932_11220, partial [Arcobacter sp.]|nr:hypothetical protein [Arcobacter sp.]
KQDSTPELLSHISIESFHKLKEIEETTTTTSKVVNHIDEKFDKFINKLTDSNYLNRIPPNKDIQNIKFTYSTQKAPIIPDEFISRTNKINQISKCFSNKPILFLYGITRSSKSMLVSQFVRKYFPINYYWYDFKRIDENKDLLFFNDFVSFISKKNQNKEVIRKWNEGDKSIQAIIDQIKVLTETNNFLFVFDNIHLMKEVSYFNEFIKQILSECRNSFKLVIISEYKDTLIKAVDIKLSSETIKLNGFGTDEIKDLFELNKIDINELSDKLFKMIQYSTEGHPDIINGLIAKIIRNQDSSSSSKTVVDNMLSGWEKIPETQIIIQTLAEKINENILTDDKEIKLFARLSILIGVFTEELAEHVSRVNPIVNNFGIYFRNIRNKLLDIEASNKYRVPTIFKKAGEEYISQKEKSKIYFATASYLLIPKENILKFDDGVLACNYFLLSKNIKDAYGLGGNLLAQALTQFESDENLFIVLERLEFLLNLKTEPTQYNEYLKIAISYLEGYRRLKLQDRMSKLVSEIIKIKNEKEVDPIQKYLVTSFLTTYYLHEKKDLKEFINILNELFNIEENQKIPKEILEDYNKLSIISLPFYVFGAEENSTVQDLITILNCFIKYDKKLINIFEPSALTKFFDLYFGQLYSKISKSIDNKEKLFSTIISDLNELAKLFKKENHFSAIRDIYYLIGTLTIDFMKEPFDALKKFEEARVIQDKYLEDDFDFIAKIHLGVADTHFKCKKYKSAETEYSFSLEKFLLNEINHILVLHVYNRLAICQYYNDKIIKGEKSFWTSIRFARTSNKYRKKNLINIFGDLSTFYVLSDNYIKALKCLSIMNTILHNDEFSPIHQLLAQSIAWIDTELKRKKPMDSEELTIDKITYTKPFWGMYNTESTFINEQASEIILLYMLGTSFNRIAQQKKTIAILKRIIKLKPIKEMDFSTRYLSIMLLVEGYLNSLRYEELLNEISKFITIIEEVTKRPLNNIVYNISSQEHIDQMILKPIEKNLLKKNKSISEFELKKEFIENLILTFEKLNLSNNVYFTSRMYSIYGWSYYKNSHLDLNFSNLSKPLLEQSNLLANKIKETSITINNNILLQFVLSNEISNSRYINEIFITLIKIISEWGKNSDFAESYIHHFSYVWLNIIPPNGLSTSNKFIFTTMKDSVSFINALDLNSKDKILALAIYFLMIRNECNLQMKEMNHCITIVVNNINNNLKKIILPFLVEYHGIKKKLILKSITDDIKTKKIVLDAIKQLKILRTNIKKSITTDIDNKIVEIESDFKSLLT